MRKSTVSVSIIIPVYNRELYIGRCLRSLLNQSASRKSYEIIVIDDGSKDNTPAILNAFKDEIILIKNKKNLGLPESLNIGIKNSKGRFIVRVDSDDYVNKEFIKLLELYLLHNNHIQAVSCDYFKVDNNENTISQENSKKNPIGCAIMFRVESLIDIGLYDKNFRIHEEKDLRIRFLKKYKIERLPIPLYRYRFHEGNITKKKLESKAHLKKLISKHSN